MFSITLICMGKLKERFYTEAAAEYAKRLKAYCDFQLIELPECRLPEDPNDTQIAQGLQKEAELIRAKLPKGCFFCVLTPEGKLLSSEQLADTLRQAKSGGRRPLTCGQSSLSAAIWPPTRRTWPRRWACRCSTPFPPQTCWPTPCARRGICEAPPTPMHKQEGQ